MAHPVAYTLQPDNSRHWTVHPREHWPLASEIRAEIDDSLVSTAGPLSVAAGASASFETTDGVRARIPCVEQAGCTANGFTIDFSLAVHKEDLKNIRMNPRPKGLSIRPVWPTESQVTEVSVTGEFVVGTTYQVEIDESLRTVEDYPIVGNRVFGVDIGPPRATLALSSHEAILSATRPPRIGIESRHLKDVTLELSKLDDAELAWLLARQAPKREMPAHLAPARKQILLEPRGRHAWASTAIDLAKEMGAKHGALFLRVIPGATVHHHDDAKRPPPREGLFQVTDLGALVGLSPALSFVRISRLSTGMPVAGAYVTVFAISESNAQTHGRYGPSDSDGIVRLPPDHELPKNAIAVVEASDDRFALDMRASRIEGDSSTPHHQGETWTLGTLVTDRPLYQAGDRVRVIGWAARSTPNTASNLEPAGRRKVEIQLVDPRGQVVASRTVRIKEHGKFWAELALPKHARLGRFYAQAKIGKQDRFEKSFEVRDVRMPALSVPRWNEAMSVMTTKSSFEPVLVTCTVCRCRSPPPVRRSGATSVPSPPPHT